MEEDGELSNRLRTGLLSPPLSGKDIPVQTTVLVVDDEPGTRKLLRMHLEAAGYQVLTAEDGPEALETLKNSAVDAVITDMAMPLMHGFDLVHTIRQTPEWSHLPIVVISALSTTISRDEMRRKWSILYGRIDAVLVKPVSPHDLLPVLEKLLAPSTQP